MRAVPRLCEFYPGICLTTEEKARKNLSQVKKNLSQSTVYILPTHTHTHTHRHTLQNNINPPQYKLKQTQHKIYPNETVARSIKIEKFGGLARRILTNVKQYNTM